MKNYQSEREGQIAFFENFAIDYKDKEVLIDNTDGVWNGNILEFKKNISNLNKVLFQAIKYLSRMRVKGEPVPANILLIDLNSENCYLYHSQDYFEDIHKIYYGGASTDNEDFIGSDFIEKIDYSNQEGSQKVIELLKENNYMKIRLDENCIVGWAKKYYEENPNAKKSDFLGDENGKIKIKGEIREPKLFKDYILPYTNTTNEKFKYLMDCLNDKLSKKDLGAFYTPMLYAEKACELVKMAIDKVPAGNDYIILDRCCGTGNLEQAILNTLGKEVASHIICSTYEYYEYKVLAERLGDIVRAIIPPTEATVEYSNGCILNADAMSEEYINNPIIKKYIDSPNCTVILFENPPYHDETSGMIQGKGGIFRKSVSYVVQEMKKEVKGVATNELANRFIWSGFKYYLRQETDSYIVFSPIKYWKQYNFCNYQFEKGFIFNRQYFHATASSISCILWQNKFSNLMNFELETIDIQENSLINVKNQKIEKVLNPASKNYLKLNLSDKDEIKVWCAKDGTQALDKKIRVKSFRNNDIIAYLQADSFSIDPKVRNLTNLCLYNGNGCYLTKQKYQNVIPIWVAKHIPLDNWYEKDIYATTSDGGDKYTKDKEFLKNCLIYTCLSNQNKCLSFIGSDNRYYKNELCFDLDAVAFNDLQQYKLDKDEQILIDLWNKILKETKETKEYNPSYSYGVYQITKEINLYDEKINGKNKERIYHYPVLNGDLNTLRVKLKEYYKTHIADKMFEYELVK